jgi:hypothetical protein
LAYTKQLVPESIPATQEKSDHCIVNRYNKGCVRFTPKIVIGKKIREQIPVFENRVDRLTEKAGFAANAAYCITIDRSIAADHEWFDIQRKYPTGISLNFGVNKK